MADRNANIPGPGHIKLFKNPLFGDGIDCGNEFGWSTEETSCNQVALVSLNGVKSYGNLQILLTSSPLLRGIVRSDPFHVYSPGLNISLPFTTDVIRRFLQFITSGTPGLVSQHQKLELKSLVDVLKLETTSIRETSSTPPSPPDVAEDRRQSSRKRKNGPTVTGDISGAFSLSGETVAETSSRKRRNSRSTSVSPLTPAGPSSVSATATAQKRRKTLPALSASPGPNLAPPSDLMCSHCNQQVKSRWHLSMSRHRCPVMYRKSSVATSIKKSKSKNAEEAGSELQCPLPNCLRTPKNRREGLIHLVMGHYQPEYKMEYEKYVKGKGSCYHCPKEIDTGLTGYLVHIALNHIEDLKELKL